MGAGTILVVDDEAPLRDLVRPYLEAEGFSVREAADGPAAVSDLRSGGIDLAIVDVMLPGFDGFTVLRMAREFTDIPVIMLTARRDEPYRVAGLRQGADDYVVKPFSVAELVARVVAQLRRGQRAEDAAEEAVRLGDIEVDLASRQVRQVTGAGAGAGSEVELTRREFDLLATLVVNPGRVLSRQALLREAWETEYLTPKTVDVHVASLRRKLGDGVTITAVRGVGYRLDPP
ncbi:MAG: response regulator transcription factor [Acidimicrobiales bacterium]